MPVLLHPVFGLVILLGLLFVMFQAVFTWAQPLMELISAGFEALGALVHNSLPDGLLQSFLQDGVIAPQCASTLAVIRRETGSWRWMAITFGYMLALAYLASLVTYNVAVALGAG